MLVTSLLMGTMYPAIDTSAGERNSGDHSDASLDKQTAYCIKVFDGK